MKMLIYRLRLKNCLMMKFVVFNQRDVSWPLHPTVEGKNCLTQKLNVFVARCYLRTNPMGLFPKNCLLMKYAVFHW